MILREGWRKEGHFIRTERGRRVEAAQSHDWRQQCYANALKPKQLSSLPFYTFWENFIIPTGRLQLAETECSLGDVEEIVMFILVLLSPPCSCVLNTLPCECGASQYLHFGSEWNTVLYFLDQCRSHHAVSFHSLKWWRRYAWCQASVFFFIPILWPSQTTTWPPVIRTLQR